MKFYKFLLLFVFLFAVNSTVIVNSSYAAKNSDDIVEDVVNKENFFDLKPLFLSITTQDGTTEQISLLITIEIEEGNLENLVNYRPRLRNAYIKDLYAMLSDSYNAEFDNFIEVEEIKSNLLYVTKSILSDKYKVKDIVLHVVQQGRL